MCTSICELLFLVGDSVGRWRPPEALGVNDTKSCIFDHLIKDKAKCYIIIQWNIILTLLYQEFAKQTLEFTTLRPLTDVKEFVIFLFVSECLFDLACFGTSPFPPWATAISMQQILQYAYVSPLLEIIKHENSCLCYSVSLWLYFPLLLRSCHVEQHM
jgi:hypothetical protein